MTTQPSGPDASPQDQPPTLAEQVALEYDPEGDVNLSGFVGSLSAYAAAVATLLAIGRATGRGMPERYDVTDVVLGGIATHKFARLLGKASVTSPLRAPFTEFGEPGGSAEHVERARDSSGVRHTIGELLTCPFCLGVWTGTGYIASLALAPRAGRAWAALFTVTALSDSLQHVYARLRED